MRRWRGHGSSTSTTGQKTPRPKFVASCSSSRASTTTSGLSEARIGLEWHDWPGTGGGRLYLAHATGFCKEVWRPLVAELRRAGTGQPVVAWDFRCHGGSAKIAHPIDWWDFAEDVKDVAAAFDERPRIAVGHSMGAAALAMAAVTAPGIFDRLVLIDPIIYPPPYRRLGSDNPMSVVAAKRKPSFDSPAEALENFRTKDVFAEWDRRALEGYVEGGLRPDGGAWWLACSPEDEAEIYRSAGAHGAFERLTEIPCPVLVIGAGRSDAPSPEQVRAIADRLPDGRAVIMDEATHFVPMERPRDMARLVGGFLE